VLKAYLYDASGHDHEIDLATGKLPQLAQDRILWVELTGRRQSEIALLGEMLGLEPATVSALEGSLTVSLSNFGDYFHCGVVAVRPAAEKRGNGAPIPSTVGLDLVVGKNWLLTVVDDEIEFLRLFRERDRGETLIGKLSSGTLAASFLDWHLTAYLDALEALEGWLDLLDVRLLASKATDRSLLKNVVEGRRFVSRMRRNLAPQRVVFYGLARPDFALVAGTEAGEAFRALERRYDRVLDAVEHSRELVRGSFDLFTTRIAESTNVLIRRLTFVSLALGGIGAVAGVFGMNFDTPYTESGTAGFWLVIISLAALVVGGFFISRSRGWL
jgi:magnesium transporter